MPDKIDFETLDAMIEGGNTPECPFCHQKLICVDPDCDPRMHCHCGDAMRYQNRRRSYEKTLGFLARAFGPDCGEQNPAWKPADPETMLHLYRCVEFVTLGGHDSFENCYWLDNSTDRETVRQALENAPAADVAPVVHGTWMVLATENHTDAVCSVCKKSFYYHNKGQYHIDHSNYCPNCGAKMDGGQR